MNVLMISMDASLLTDSIGNARTRHEFYAEQLGHLSLAVCTRRNLPAYESPRVAARPTRSRSTLHYLIDGYRLGLAFHQECPVDVIAAQDPFLTALIGLTLRWRLHVPLIIQDHSCVVDNPHFAAEQPRNRLLQRLARWTLRRADAIRAVNTGERRACLRHGIPSERVCVIPVAPALAQFSPADNIPDPPTALWVGRVVAFKNVPLLLRAFARVHAALPHARLILAASVEQDAARDHLLAHIRSLGLEGVVEPRWSVAHVDLPALHHQATVYAHASNYEGFGLVLAEAAASRLPAVTTDTDGARDIVIDGETGLIVPVGDEAALAGALIALLSDPSRARDMGRRARERVCDQFDEDRLLRAWVAMIRAVTEGKPPCVS
ncbi:MAG TPA: glycosyltransferase [Aggregatilineales bacterium]|nr:glycosyltransferase [Aggregatilineales bacterium]